MPAPLLVVVSGKAVMGAAVIIGAANDADFIHNTKERFMPTNNHTHLAVQVIDTVDGKPKARKTIACGLMGLASHPLNMSTDVNEVTCRRCKTVARRGLGQPSPTTKVLKGLGDVVVHTDVADVGKATVHSVKKVGHGFKHLAKKLRKAEAEVKTPVMPFRAGSPVRSVATPVEASGNGIEVG